MQSFYPFHNIIEKGGKPIASMKAIDDKIAPMTLGELKPLLEKLPRLEDELDDFAVSSRRTVSENHLYFYIDIQQQIIIHITV